MAPRRWNSVFAVAVILPTLVTATSASVMSSRQQDDRSMDVLLDDDGRYAVVVDGVPWFDGTPPFLRALGRTFSAADGSLVLESTPPFAVDRGADDLGAYEATTVTYATVGAGAGVDADGELRLECTAKRYLDVDGGDLVVFTQTLPDGAPAPAGTPEDVNGVVTSYPGFRVGWNSANVELGYLSTGGHMLGQSNLDLSTWTAGTWKIHSGESGGILVVFDKTGESGAVVMTPLDNFMNTNMQRDLDEDSISFGVMGGVSEVPPGYSSSTILARGNGIRSAVALWGEALRRHHGTFEVSHASSDLSVTHLGYWTDNGAYYYYQTEEGLDYEETVAAVVEHYTQVGVPIKYFQIDSWWYFKGLYDGVKNWTERGDIFPSGLKALRERIRMPIVAHNRYFAPDTVYANQNGGSYEFVVENRKALPTSRAFWDDLLTDATEWGLIVYEQDWLDQTFMDMSATHTDLNFATNWLAQMHNAAEERGINIQYCMALTRFGLESVKHPRVTQIRVSEDYAATIKNWRVGISSMIADALGKAAFKDTFRTDQTAVKEMCARGGYGVDLAACTRELHPALHAAISSLTAGPVGPGDKIGSEDAAMLRKSCMADGKLLKPDRPATAIDPQLRRAAFGDSDPSIGPKGEVWSTTVSYPGQGLTFGIVFVGDLKEPYELELGAGGAEVLPPDVTDVAGQVYAYRVSDHDEFAGFTTFGPTDKLPLEASSLANFSSIWYTSPVIRLEEPGVSVAILGEMDKWVPVSKQRTVDVSVGSGEIRVDLEGAEGETIEYAIAESVQDSQDFELVRIGCSFGPSGHAVLAYPAKTCG